MMPSRWSFSWKCHDDSGGSAIHHSLEAVDAGIDPTWRCAWLLVEAGVVALALAFQGVASLPVVVAQFVVNGAMFLLSFQALSGGWNFPTPEFGSLDGGYCQCGGTAPSSLSQKLRAHGF
ncbi:MAG: hypothetical protein ABSC18_08445 [Verrucomicrobiota bacterium]|jgi:hypothetical protein